MLMVTGNYPGIKSFCN